MSLLRIRLKSFAEGVQSLLNMKKRDIGLECLASLKNVLSKCGFWNVFNGLKVDYSKPYVRISWKLPFAISKGVVVDCETTGLPIKRLEVNGGIVEERGDVHMVSFSFMEQNMLYCYGLWNPHAWKQFEQICRNLLKNKKPLYAYTCSFEELFLGFKYNWIDCLEYGEGYSEWYDEYYVYRKSLVSAAYSYGLRIHFYDVNGSQIPNMWKRYVQHANFKCLWEIMYHNSVDVIRLGWIVWRKENRAEDNTVTLFQTC